MQEYEGRFVWSGSWKETYAATYKRSRAGTAAATAGHPPEGTEVAAEEPEPPRKKGRPSAKKGPAAAALKKGLAAAAPKEKKPGVLRVEGFYSDLLYQPWFCTCVDLRPEWLEVDNIDRSAICIVFPCRWTANDSKQKLGMSPRTKYTTAELFSLSCLLTLLQALQAER